MTRFTPSLSIFALLALTACAGEQSTPVTNPGTSPQDDAALYDWLVGEEVPVQSALLAVPDPARLDASKVQDEPRYKVGVAVPLDAAVSFASLDAADLSQPVEVAGGRIRADGPDGFVWSARIEAPEASALRLKLFAVDLPDGVELYTYSNRGEVGGPYSGASDWLYTNTLRGDVVYLQVRYAGIDVDAALDALSFEVFDVHYLDDRFTLARYPSATERDYRSFCSFNASCIDNASCGGNTDAAIGEMVFASGAFLYLCTGGLIDNDSGAPMFLTANHCISKNNEANSLETFFGYTTSCGGACDFPQTATTTGSHILSKGRSSDYTLLELDQDPGIGGIPYDSNPVAFDHGAALTRVSHPSGAPQAYSEHLVDTGAGTCGGLPRGNFIYSYDWDGGTEGGSSGSPVLYNGKIVGQLYGACGTNLNDVCDADANATVDGAFAAYFSNVQPILESGGSGCLTDADGDGYCLETDDCDDTNPAVNPGASEICGNGIDDDCQGGDEACGQCNQRGDSCTQDSECCSNKCKGRGGNKTCK